MKSSANAIRFIPFVIWVIIVYILLTLPGKDFGNAENIIPQMDKIAHITLFGGCVFWFGFALINIDKNKTRTATIIITIISCLYGVAMEYVQKYWTNGTRDFSYGDMIADSIGAVIGYFVIRWIAAKYQAYCLAKNSIKS